MDLPALWYHWLVTHGVGSKWAHWLAHPWNRAANWCYWRGLLLLPNDYRGWRLNTKRNRDRDDKEMRLRLGKYHSGME
jgi:hypothetical protein